ncbi:electron transfer flavoprotein subunit beta/FixA family protein [Candidatus Poriferisodalis sp.]|uniref:electron transfer flavoprotein subunit beta/FixA family protein n=1 Tax=Candidatus Poriferisodalis sp. TaxID=3101277 RepID=UPI003B01964F
MKRVPAVGARINVAADGRQVDTAHLGFTTSPHEECALEEAVQIVEGLEGDGHGVVVLTLGPEAATEQLRYAAGVGGTEFALVAANGGLDWDPQRTAAALTAAVRELEAAGGQFDLILFGNESADGGNFQVGIRVAHALGRPIVNGIKGIERHERGFTARRETDAGHEVYELESPCALGVKEGINLPRYPTMKGRLASRRAQIQVLDGASDTEAGGQARVRLRRPPEAAGTTVVLGDSAAAAPAVVDLLDELGVL